MKKLNRLDVLIKEHLTNKEQRFLAKHSKKRVIDLDSDEEGGADDDNETVKEASQNPNTRPDQGIGRNLLSP